MTWFWFLYISIGLFAMMNHLVEAWYLPEYSITVKIISMTIIVLIWPTLLIK